MDEALADFSSAAAEEADPLPLESSLVGIGKVARTISRLWEVPFSLRESLGTTGGFVTSGGTSLAISISFSTISACCTSLEGLLRRGRTLAGTSLLGSESLKAVSTLEPEKPDAQMARG